MKPRFVLMGPGLLLPLFLSVCLAGAATRYVSPLGGHVPPFTDWPSAATNIQAAIDSSSDGDLILVTNGVYSTGGKPTLGTLTNRVAIDKAVTVQSLNGPRVTMILGSTSSSAPPIRCAWLTNGATLSGFYLLLGLTQGTGDASSQQGAGVWCSSASALVTNCVLFGNTAWMAGGGAFGGTIKNCVIQGCSVLNSSASAAGANGSVLVNCLIAGNYNYGSGVGGTYSCFLSNCTVVYNSGFSVGGSQSDRLYNSIVYFNSARLGSTPNYYFNSTFQYCCTTPLPSGTGNISSDPQLLGNIHISAGSPCRGKGSSAYAIGVDVNGRSWSNPPSMGCEEWHAEPAILPYRSIQPGSKVGEATIAAQILGQDPVTCWWTKDGAPVEETAHYGNVHTTNLLVRNFGIQDGGLYQLTASNGFGMASAQVIQPTVRCVSAAGVTPAFPFIDWTGAATNIQDALDAADPVDIVLVTNGIYSSGAVWDGSVSNRVYGAGKFWLLLLSLNGPEKTVIEGQRAGLETNSPPPIRCVSDTSVSGFTLRNGEATGFLGGGGIYDGTVAFCILSNNAAEGSGGGATFCNLNSCLITRNSSKSTGGGVYNSSLNDCTVVFNSAPAPGTGVGLSRLTNCIVYFNVDPSSGSISSSHDSSVMQNCCSLPLPSGAGNISADPQLMDASHISPNSPCRAAGMALGITASDLDGEDWANPPSIGCDEVVTNDFVGPLAVSLSASWTEVPVGRNIIFTGQVSGRAASLEWSFGDGPTATNLSYTVWHSWTSVGDYTVTLNASNLDSPLPVSTNILVHVVPLVAPILSPAFSGGTNFSAQFSGQAGVSYVLEKTAGLTAPITWGTVQAVFSTGGLVQVIDNAANIAAQFYRVRTQ